MKRIVTLLVAVIALAGTNAWAANITCPGATPNPIGVVVKTRIFNDCPTSVLNVTNSYPLFITFDESALDCFGYANLHTWSWSTDGVNEAQFENCSQYSFHATVTLSGTGVGEGGLRLSPWWASDTDGKFMLNANTGEISCFGGRLPFYSFTAAYGLHYVKGTQAILDIAYNPQALTSALPAQITYTLFYNSTMYTSGPLNFDEGNVTEEPIYGGWGELTPAYAGGYDQPYVGAGVPVTFKAEFDTPCFYGPNPTPAPTTSWGKLKTRYR